MAHTAHSAHSSPMHPPQSLITPPRLSKPAFTPIQSNSTIHLPSLPPNRPHTPQDSPAQRLFRGVLDRTPNPRGQCAQAASVPVENCIDSSATTRSRTRAPFKPQKANRGTTSWQLKEFAEATLGSGSLRKAVKLPDGEDENEWLAVNVVDFYNQINLLYGSITEFCSPQTCPEMKATDE